ncbi:uncharacterized protein ASCRUDRAFT_8633 [Ascoidea rubescens DSM 1968]|uniref:Lipoprotein n=1 Tax=Ascoidea rubescens DSM 1968 TaxID=1344418 RepID=A0A1D2VFJ7_9ASCO|nr:hypothetical protein ASCRUDRAFT_8633 [Ascoidea rubescens DSM 1968]ODV60406.1 hypothetical protein ASCRUDRAFT_8633 [Ascoidea rubescens DSM 1968]
MMNMIISKSLLFVSFFLLNSLFACANLNNSHTMENNNQDHLLVGIQEEKDYFLKKCCVEYKYCYENVLDDFFYNCLESSKNNKDYSGRYNGYQEENLYHTTNEYKNCKCLFATKLEFQCSQYCPIETRTMFTHLNKELCFNNV